MQLWPAHKLVTPDRILYIYKHSITILSEGGAPDRILPFAASRVHVLDPLDRIAHPTAPPVKRRDADVPRLRFPLAVFEREGEQRSVTAAFYGEES